MIEVSDHLQISDVAETRLKSEERRCAIQEAAKRVFSRLGLSGAKTKDIAQEAGVSEALLYRHFPRPFYGNPSRIE